MSECSYIGCTLPTRYKSGAHCVEHGQLYQRFQRVRRKKVAELLRVLQQELDTYPERDTDASWQLVLRRLGYGPNCPVRAIDQFERWLLRQAGFPSQRGPRSYKPDLTADAYKHVVATDT